MKLRNKSVTPNIDKAVSRSVDFEVTVTDIARRSERRAWFVAFSAITMSLILAGGYFFLLPLKEKVPYLVMADAYTGTGTVAKLRDDFRYNSITASEAINRSNVAHYVLSRESYDYALMGLRDWRTVFVMSSNDVATAFKNLYANNNPASPYVIYGKTRSIRIKILSLVLIGGGDGGTPKGATVRFQRSIFDKTAGVEKPIDSKLATIAFVYQSNLKMDDADRMLNPLGFRVTDYRVDNDFSSAPAVGIEAPQEAPPEQGMPSSETLPAAQGAAKPSATPAETGGQTTSPAGPNNSENGAVTQ